jgi:hypothetical protein
VAKPRDENVTNSNNSSLSLSVASRSPSSSPTLFLSTHYANIAVPPPLGIARLIASSPSAQRALDLFNAASSQRGFSKTPAIFSSLLVRLACRRLRALPVPGAAVASARPPPPARPRARPPPLAATLIRTSDDLVDLRAACHTRRSLPRLTASSPPRLLPRCPRQAPRTQARCVYNILIKHHAKIVELEPDFKVLDEMREDTRRAWSHIKH